MSIGFLSAGATSSTKALENGTILDLIKATQFTSCSFAWQPVRRGGCPWRVAWGVLLKVACYGATCGVERKSALWGVAGRLQVWIGRQAGGRAAVQRTDRAVLVWLGALGAGHGAGGGQAAGQAGAGHLGGNKGLGQLQVGHRANEAVEGSFKGGFSWHIRLLQRAARLVCSSASRQLGAITLPYCRFGVAFNCPAETPYFPVARPAERAGFAIGLENSGLLYAALDRAVSTLCYDGGLLCAPLQL